MTPVTKFPNGIDAGVSLEADALTQGGTAFAFGAANIVDGAGTITTPLTSVTGFTLGIAGGSFGTAAQAQAYAVGGSATTNKIVVAVTAYGGTAMGGTASINYTAWGT